MCVELFALRGELIPFVEALVDLPGSREPDFDLARRSLATEPSAGRLAECARRSSERGGPDPARLSLATEPSVRRLDTGAGRSRLRGDFDMARLSIPTDPSARRLDAGAIETIRAAAASARIRRREASSVGAAARGCSASAGREDDTALAPTELDSDCEEVRVCSRVEEVDTGTLSCCDGTPESSGSVLEASPVGAATSIQQLARMSTSPRRSLQRAAPKASRSST